MNTTENQKTYDELETLIKLYKSEIEELIDTNSKLHDKANHFEAKSMMQDIEIEGLKQKNIVLTDKFESKKIECAEMEKRYFDAREKGNAAIHNLEMSQFWKTISLIALGVVSAYAIGLSLTHFSN